MKRKATKQSPGPRKRDRDFIQWVKGSPCICCGHPGPSIADHIDGSTAKKVVEFQRIQYGLFAVIPLCACCDEVKTRGSRLAFREKFGSPHHMWLALVNGSEWSAKFSDTEKRAVMAAA